MDEPERTNLTQCSSGRRSCGDSNSPEFEFWMVGNPSFPQPNLLSADELFSGGVLLPLHHLRISHPPQQPESSGSGHAPDPETSGAEPAAMSATTPALTSSKRWTDIFRKNEKKIDNNNKEMKENISSVKEKRREKRSGGGGGGGGASTAAELNINIWPFSRSRSAGNGGTRPRTAAAASRKVSSAPCSRSNSRGDSKSRKWPSSPAKGGVHLGRSSPVWQVRRGGGGRSSDGGGKNEGRRKVAVAGGSTMARVLSLNVPMCIGYRHQLSCRSDASGVAAAAVVAGGGGSGEGVRGSNLFSIKSLFTRKVY